MQATQVERLKRWSTVHTWTSLIATVFLLMLCLTGLPLIFDDEISDWSNPPPAGWTVGSPISVSLDDIAAQMRAKYPNDVMISFGFAKTRPLVTADSASSAKAPFAQFHRQTFDLRTGQPTDLKILQRGPVMTFIRNLHTDLLLGLPGALFLGAVALTLVAAIVSGVVLYVPFMHRLAFGTVRRSHHRRIVWLDLHNLLGIVTVAWLTAVSITGAINTLHDPVAAAVRADIMKMGKGYSGPPATNPVSADAALKTAREALPGGALVSLFYPGAGFSTPHHFAIFARGDRPVTAELFYAALIDAETGKLAMLYEMPWYAKILLLSQPLHFGDYGGLPLKIIWALFDLVTIIVLGSGLYLWIAKRRRTSRPLSCVTGVS